MMIFMPSCEPKIIPDKTGWNARISSFHAECCPREKCQESWNKSVYRQQTSLSPKHNQYFNPVLTTLEQGKLLSSDWDWD